MKKICTAIAIFLLSSPAFAATSVPFTIAMSEAVNVTGSPRIAVDVGGVTRYATYASGTGTSSLTFTYAAQAGDVDLDGISISSPIDLNGGTITDLNGNPETNLTFTVPNTSGIKIDYPSLSMDFIADADGRYTLNGTAYNDLPAFLSATGGTFARNSVGTYFDSAGVLQTASANQPRFDHDPVTQAPKGILIEESRTNSTLYSINMSNGVWLQNGSTLTENAGISPSGVNDANLISGSVNINTGIYQNISVTANTTYTLSMFVKLGTMTASDYKFAVYNVNAGSFIQADITPTETLSNTSWVRVVYTFTTPAGCLIARIYPYRRNTGLSTARTVYVWGVQLEAGSFPTSYIPTTTAVTRAADSFTIPVTGWFDFTQGAFMYELDYTYAANPVAQGLRIGASGNQGYLLYKQGTSSNLYAFAGTAATNLGPLSNNTDFKAGMSYSTSSARGVLNGALSPSITPTGIVTPTSIQPYSSYTGHIHKFKYYPTVITNTQLQLLTQ